jgi:signal transduction histidine kinase
MYTVADADGMVVVPSPNNPIGTQLSKRELARGMSIEVNGEVVGTVISQGPLPNTLITALDNFSDEINQLLLMGALAAVGISLILGVIFSRTLTRQLGEISKAADDIAKGKLNQKVEIKSKDEIGQLAEAFNQMSANLERSGELRRQMTADIAHELRTPLSIILGRAEPLAEGTLLPSREVLQVIHEETMRVNRLVEDLRTLSLSDAGELSLEVRPVTLCQLLGDVKKVHMALAEAKGAALKVECPDQLPSIKADPDRIRQVLGNLVSNAIRYSPEGGSIILSAMEVEQGVVIRVSDNGPGIAEEDLPHVFDRFYRGDKSRQRDKGGSGLGLAIAKSLVYLHGGDIRVNSQPGAGTTFTVWLPIFQNQRGKL